MHTREAKTRHESSAGHRWRTQEHAARIASLALAAVVLSSGHCVEPPRARRSTAKEATGTVATRPPENGDWSQLVPVSPVRPHGGGPVVSAAEANTEPPGAASPDAGLTPVPPPLSEEELFEIQYPMHALVIASFSPVYHKPDSTSTRLGYLRKGARVRTGLKVERGRGCIGGNWYPLPEKGFICSRSLKVDLQPPQAADVPRQPDRDQEMPYRYGLNRQNRTYALTRLPNAEELALVQRRREELLQEDEAARAAALAAADAEAANLAQRPTETEGVEPEGEAPPPDRTREPVVAREGEFEHVPGTEPPEVIEPPPEAPEPDAGTASRSPDAGVAVPRDAGTPEIVYTLAGPPPGTPTSDLDRVGGLVGQWLEEGFYISIDRNTAAAGERFYRTIRGLYVPSRYIGSVEIPTYRGLVITADMPLPIGFAGRGRVRTYTRVAGRRSLVESGRIARQAYRFLREKERVGAAEYWVTTDGQYVRAHQFGVVQEEDPPPGVLPDGKWIQVDLSDQLLVAFEGRRPVFAALVSSGKEGFETPPGSYAIVSKHVSATMDGITEADGAYSIEDVPWAMFFLDNFAIHGAFWHNQFGMTRSHGCVNMSPIDAKWIFEWSEPRVPDGWHGVISSPLQPGTPVVVRE